MRPIRALAVLLLAMLPLGRGSASEYAGHIEGIVFHGAQTIPGTVLTLESPALASGALECTSDETGAFQFRPGVGTYSLLAEKKGFGRVTLTTVEVLWGQTTRIAVEMKVGREQVITKAQRGFTAEFLAHIPCGRCSAGSAPADTPASAPAP